MKISRCTVWETLTLVASSIGTMKTPSMIWYFEFRFQIAL